VKILKSSDVVFMYAATDPDVYRAYGTTFVGWGGASDRERVTFHHDLGVRCTGSMWCLTAGAKRLHEDAALREAVARDIAGEPIAVPWLWSHTHEGTPSWFGCTNNPVFRKHNRDCVREVMAGGADGLHVDDHLGVATTATWMGVGCFCDWCMAAFCDWLKNNIASECLHEEAGIETLDGFDYRHLVRRFAANRKCYQEVHALIPLMDMFKRFQLEAAADNVRELGMLAAEVAGHPVVLSANAAMPESRQIGLHQVVWKHVTHVIGEVEHHASEGTDRLNEAIALYRLAAFRGKPLAATAAGVDWAFVKANRAEDLVRVWIATAYAHGQFFMPPHHAYCFTEENGTDWYDGPVEAYAPLYRFVRKNAVWLDDFEEMSEVTAMDAPAGRGVWRCHPEGAVVLHALNWNYDRQTRQLKPLQRVQFTLPPNAVPSSGSMRLLSCDRPDETVTVQYDGNRPFIEIPELRLWTLAIPCQV
jgi:hypothetical protein